MDFPWDVANFGLIALGMNPAQIDWMLSTDFTDKNDTEIFAGDVVSCISWDTCNFHSEENKKEFRAVVEFKYGCWYLGRNNFSYTAPFYELNEGHKQLEIIGNIHQHPELMEAKPRVTFYKHFSN